MEAQDQLTQVVATPDPAYETCEQCGAPVDSTQRYCVECGTRRKHVADPAARFMSTATSTARAAARAQQLAAGGARAGRGVGLGLALSRQWATLLGGILSVRSGANGSGACFALELPAT